MARRAAKVEEVEEEVERDFTGYVDKDPTPKQERFTDWILRVTGYEPGDEDDFRMGAKLGQVLYMHYQKSDENQEILAELRAAREEEAAKPKVAKKRGRPTAVADADEADETDEDEVEETPAPRRKATARKPAATTRKAAPRPAAKAAAKPRARRAAKAKDDDAAPF
jgi:hypothetical protein